MSASRCSNRFVEAGGNFIDTADVYSRGASEEIIGRWLAGRRRDDLVIATKVRFGTDDPAARGVNRFGLSRKHIMSAVEASLRRLQDRLHRSLSGPSLGSGRTAGGNAEHARHARAERQGALSRRQQLHRLAAPEGVDMAQAHGWEPFVCLQPLYNLLDRDIEWELLPVCRNEGLGVIPWSPLRGGWLTGKFHRGMAGPPADSRVKGAEERGWSESWTRYGNEATWSVIDTLLAVSEAAGKTPAQVALNWVSRRPGVTAPIVGARTVEQLDANIGSTGWSLTPEQAKKLDDASARRLPYPYEQQARLAQPRPT